MTTTTKIVKAPFSPLLDQPRKYLENENSVSGWMPTPRGNFNCLSGLQYLMELNQIIIHQKFDLQQYGFEGATEFVVKNYDEEQIYFAKEESKFWKRELFRSVRPMTFKISDSSKRDVITINRPLRGYGCCCARERCFQSIEIVTESGKAIGYVKQEGNAKNVRFLVQNAYRDTVLKVIGPTNQYPDDLSDFVITTRDGSNTVGKIVKKWLGPSGNITMRSDIIIVSFPPELDVTTKALLLATGFLIIFMYYENRQIYPEYTYRY